MERTDILSMTKDELAGWMISLGEPKYRAAQIMEWLVRGADFSEMKNLPATLRQTLQERAYLASVVPDSRALRRRSH